MTVVKVQIPIRSNDPAMMDRALVYAEGRRRMVQQTIDEVTRVAMGNDFRAFFDARFSKGRWIIGRRVRDQDW